MSSFLIITDSKKTNNQNILNDENITTGEIYQFLDKQLKAIGYDIFSKKFAFETELPILTEIENKPIDYIIIDVPQRIKLSELFQKIVIKKEFLKDYSSSNNITRLLLDKKTKVPYIILFTEKESINITPNEIPVFIEDIILKNSDPNLILAKLAILIKRHSIDYYNKFKTEKLIRIFNSSNIIIIELDKNFHIKFINKKGLKTFNATYESMENKIFFDIVTKDPQYKNSIHYLFNYHLQNNKKRFNFESLIQNTKGNNVMLNWLVEVIKKGSNIENFTIVGYEITSQLKIGEEFEKYTHSLMNKNRSLKEELADIKRSTAIYKKEIHLAKRIQKGIIPRNFPNLSGAQVSATYVPMDDMGGDFYDSFPFDKSFGIVICDVVGHGIPAALVTSMTKVLTHSLSRRIFSPSDFAKNINNELYKLLIAGNFLTLFVAHYDYLNHVLKFASGGHLPQIFCRKDSGDFLLLNSTGPVMGIIPNSLYDEKHIDNVQAGDRLILFTDGITEAKNPDTKEMFGIKRLLHSIKSHYNKDINGFKESILEDVAKFNLGGKVDDDVSIMIIEFIQ